MTNIKLIRNCDTWTSAITEVVVEIFETWGYAGICSLTLTIQMVPSFITGQTLRGTITATSGTESITVLTGIIGINILVGLTSGRSTT